MSAAQTLAHEPARQPCGIRRLPGAALVVIGVLSAAIIASFITMALALSGSESPLPEPFHWEGERLDRDFDLAARAAALEVTATLELSGRGGTCRAALRIAGAAPRELRVSLTHATRSTLDREYVLHHGPNGYESACEAVPDGAWYVTISDSARSWRVRELVRGSLDRLTLAAVATQDH